MKICALTQNSFYGNNNNRCQNNYLLYPTISGIGSYVGYAIPLKEIDGQDITVPSRGGLAMKIKTKVPNIVGKWKNALAGAFIGMGAAIIADIIITRICNNKTKAQEQSTAK